MKITNEEVIERIMRMGIEGKHDSSFPYLEKLAIQQLTLEKSRRLETEYPASVNSVSSYIAHCLFEKYTTPYAFLKVDDKLQVVRLTNNSTIPIKWMGFTDSAIFPTVAS